MPRRIAIVGGAVREYLEFFDIETATPMQTWDQGTRRLKRAFNHYGRILYGWRFRKA